MPDEPDELKEAFLHFNKKFQRNTEVCNKLLLLLDKLENMNCLPKEDCNTIKYELQKKSYDGEHV